LKTRAPASTHKKVVVALADRKSLRVYGSTMGDRRTLADNDVESILEDRTGALWIGGVCGLTRLDRAAPRPTGLDRGGKMARAHASRPINRGHCIQIMPSRAPTAAEPAFSGGCPAAGLWGIDMRLQATILQGVLP